MNSFPNYFTIAGNNIRRWATNPRIYILAALLIIFLWDYIGPILHFSQAVGYRVSPWVFPFLSNTFYIQMILMLGIVFLFCDAPFLNEGQPYLLIRSGRVHWAVGQVLYIMIGTALYFLFVASISILMLAPNLYISTDWGKVLATLAQTDAGQVYHILLGIDHRTQLLYTPFQAFCLSLFLDWCAGTILGLVIFIINNYLNRAIGAIVASAIIFFERLIYNALSDVMYHFSPVSMARLARLDPSGLSLYPTITYACFFFLSSIVFLSILAVLSVRKRQIQIYPQL